MEHRAPTLWVSNKQGCLAHPVLTWPASLLLLLAFYREVVLFSEYEPTPHLRTQTHCPASILRTSSICNLFSFLSENLWSDCLLLLILVSFFYLLHGSPKIIISPLAIAPVREHTEKQWPQLWFISIHEAPVIKNEVGSQIVKWN